MFIQVTDPVQEEHRELLECTHVRNLKICLGEVLQGLWWRGTEMARATQERWRQYLQTGRGEKAQVWWEATEKRGEDAGGKI